MSGFDGLMRGGLRGGYSRNRDPFPEAPDPPPAPAKPAYFTGLDLGQQQDPSALVVVERNTVPNPDKPGATQYTFDVRHLHRWPLRTPYPDIVADVKGLFSAAPLAGTPLVIDETGVGRPVVDMFRAASIRATLRPYSITCGSAVTCNTVAKKHLVGAIQAPLVSGRLRFAEGLELTPVLVAELENFRVTVDQQTRNESYSAWRDRDNDDCVLALALCLHFANVPPAFASVAYYS